MGAILRSAGILLIIGSLLFTVGSLTSIKRAQLAAIKEGAAVINPGGLGLASWIGVALMALGVAAALFALFISLKSRRARALHVGYSQQGKLDLSFRRSQRGVSAEPDVDDVMNILNRVLEVEYSMIVNLPRWSNRIRDQSAVEKLSTLARTSMKHFDTTVAMIRRLGGSPAWGFQLDRDETDLVATLRDQLQRERLAQHLHRRVSELVTEENLRQEARAMAADEEWHAKLVEEVLSTLASSEPDQ